MKQFLKKIFFILILNVFIFVPTSTLASYIKRTEFYPLEDLDDQSLPPHIIAKTSIQKKYSDHFVEFEAATTNPEDGSTLLLCKAISPRTLRKTLVLYTSPENIHPLHDETIDFYDFLDFSTTESSIVWTGRSETLSNKLMVYKYNYKDNTNISIDLETDLSFDHIFFNFLRKTVGGAYRYDNGLIKFFLKTTQKGWVEVQSIPSDTYRIPKLSFEASAPYTALFQHESNRFIYDINTGEYSPSVGAFPLISTKNAVSFSGYKDPFFCFDEFEHGKRKWFGSNLFMHVFNTLVQILEIRLKTKDFYFTRLEPNVSHPWWFEISPQEGMPITGQYTLETNEISLSRESLISFDPEKFSPLEYSSFQWTINPSNKFGARKLSSTDLYDVFIAKPKRGEAPYPTVLIPHGGPRAHDELQNDLETQHLTSRGYMVVKTNFPGSDDSKENWKRGHGEWGRQMQTYLYDLMTHFITQGLTNPENTAILGHSYGGYTALLGSTYKPDLHSPFKGFQCAISLCGVSNPLLLLDQVPLDSDRSNIHSAFSIAPAFRFGESLNVNDINDLQAVSPIHQAHQVKIPLLMMQGGLDVQVTQNHGDLMSQALKEAGIAHTYLKFPQEGHTWENNFVKRLSLYLIEAFLGKHLKGGVFEPLDPNEVKEANYQIVEDNGIFESLLSSSSSH